MQQHTVTRLAMHTIFANLLYYLNILADYVVQTKIEKCVKKFKKNKKNKSALPLEKLKPSLQHSWAFRRFVSNSIVQCREECEYRRF